MNNEIKEIKTIGQLLYYVETEAKAKELIDYITNLQNENERFRMQLNTYENPDDLTLFYMWLDEKAKDKMKELQQKYENSQITLAEEWKKDLKQKKKSNT